MSKPELSFTPFIYSRQIPNHKATNLIRFTIGSELLEDYKNMKGIYSKRGSATFVEFPILLNHLVNEGCILDAKRLVFDILHPAGQSWTDKTWNMARRLMEKRG